MTTHQADLWVILAGGQARRMNGKDKGLISYLDQPLIEFTVDNLRRQHQAIAINANRHLETYSQWGKVFNDGNADFMGPLSGMLAAFERFPNANWIGFVPCDCPFLPDDLIVQFSTSLRHQPDAEIFVADDGERLHPTVALLNRQIVERLRHFLQRGDRKIQLFYRECHTTRVDFSHCPMAFDNLNTPEDLQRATENHTG